MKNNLRNNQGSALLIAIIALAIITGTTTLIFQSNNEVKVDKVKNRSKSAMEMERNRISSLLSDIQVCSSLDNFGGKTAINNDITFDFKTASGQVFLEKGAQYHNRTLTVNNIRTRAIAPHDANYTNYNGTPKGYILEITYRSDALNASKIQKMNTKNTIIKIPMYMRLTGANILECYAISQNDQINIAVKDSCSPLTAAANKNATLTPNSGSQDEVNDCQHNATFNSGNSTSCNDFDSLNPNHRTWLIGYDDMSSTSGSLNFPLSRCSGINKTCPAGQKSFGITSGNFDCAFPGSLRDGGCSAGQIIHHSSGSASTCVTVNCTTPGEFVQSVTGGSTTCYAAPSSNCNANEYIVSFNPTGHTCARLPAMNGACGGSDYAQWIERATGTINGQLRCNLYNRAKSCASPSPSTFVSSFDANSTASCTAF